MARVEEGHKAAAKGDAIEKDPKAAGDATAPNTHPGPNGRVCRISLPHEQLLALSPQVPCACVCQRDLRSGVSYLLLVSAVSLQHGLMAAGCSHNCGPWHFIEVDEVSEL